jgi:hypothetical protein
MVVSYVHAVCLLLHAVFNTSSGKMEIYAMNGPFGEGFRNFMELASLRANKENVAYFLVANAGLYWMMAGLMCIYEILLYKSIDNLSKTKSRPNGVKRQVPVPV